MLEWDSPSERYYEHGLDRGVLYPSDLPVGDVVEANYIFNPDGGDGTTTGWITYGVGTVIASIPQASGTCYNVYKNAAGSQFGMRTSPTPALGMSVRPAGARLTISAEIRNPIGQPAADFALIARDDTNNDSGVLTAITAGSLSMNIPADDVWRTIYATGTVKAGRNLEAIYVSKNNVPVNGENFRVRKVMINDQEIVPFFDGDSPQDQWEYSWSGTPYRSISLARAISEDRAIAWSGLVSLDEGGEIATSVYYRDGIVYLADADASDFSARLKTLAYPRYFSRCLGFPEIADGLFIDGQKPKRFGFSYRSLVGSGSAGDMFGYQIHLVYNAMASVGQRSRKSVGSSVDPVEFDFDLVCTPVKLPGFRPSAHYVIDTRNMSASVLAQLEAILYGTDTIVGRLPTPTELYDIMNFGDAIRVTVHDPISIGLVYPVNITTYTVEASYNNAYALDDHHFQVDNANVVDNGDGTWTVSDGGNTTVIIE